MLLVGFCFLERFANIWSSELVSFVIWPGFWLIGFLCACFLNKPTALHLLFAIGGVFVAFCFLFFLLFFATIVILKSLKICLFYIQYLANWVKIYIKLKGCSFNFSDGNLPEVAFILSLSLLLKHRVSYLKL